MSQKFAQLKGLHSQWDPNRRNSSPAVPQVEQAGWKLAHFILSNHHHHWLLPSLVSTLFIDRPSRLSFCRIITIIGYYHRWLVLSSSTDRRVRKISPSQVNMLLFIASSLSRPRFCLVVTPTRGLKSFQTRPVSRHSSVRIHRHYYALIILSCSFCRALTYKSWILSTAPFVEHRSISSSGIIPKGTDSIR